MENILKKNSSAHINAYNEIKFIIFGSKLKNKNVTLPQHVTKSSPTNLNQRLPEKSDSQNRESQGGAYGKKGKKKFKDLKDFQEKKKEKEGRI